MPQGKYSLGRITCFTFGREHCASLESQNSRRRIHTTNSEDNPLRMQPSMMKFLKEGGVMNGDFNMIYTCHAAHSNFNITYF